MISSWFRNGTYSHDRFLKSLYHIILNAHASCILRMLQTLEEIHNAEKIARQNSQNHSSIQTEGRSCSDNQSHRCGVIMLMEIFLPQDAREQGWDFHRSTVTHSLMRQ